MEETQSSIKYTIKQWADEDKPREKFLLKGKNSLSDVELLAILINTGTSRKSAIDLAREIMLSCNGDLNALSRLSVKELVSRIKGIGEAKAIKILAAIELGGRKQAAEVLEKPKITGSRDAYNLMKVRIGDLNHEEFWIIITNRAQKVLSIKMISEGGVSGTIVDFKKIFSYALHEHASGFIACHNHPSGNLRPSEQDNQLTQKLKESGKILDIPLLDHLIITQNGYFSYCDEGLL
jgi:DNA repair protein RadC